MSDPLLVKGFSNSVPLAGAAFGFRFGSGYLVSAPLLVKGFVTFSVRPGFRFGLRNLVSDTLFVKGLPAFVSPPARLVEPVSCLTGRLAGRPRQRRGAGYMHRANDSSKVFFARAQKTLQIRAYTDRLHGVRVKRRAVGLVGLPVTDWPALQSIRRKWKCTPRALSI